MPTSTSRWTAASSTTTVAGAVRRRAPTCWWPGSALFADPAGLEHAVTELRSRPRPPATPSREPPRPSCRPTAGGRRPTRGTVRAMTPSAPTPAHARRAESAPDAGVVAPGRAPQRQHRRVLRRRSAAHLPSSSLVDDRAGRRIAATVAAIDRSPRAAPLDRVAPVAFRTDVAIPPTSPSTSPTSWRDAPDSPAATADHASPQVAPPAIEAPASVLAGLRRPAWPGALAHGSDPRLAAAPR